MNQKTKMIIAVALTAVMCTGGTYMLTSGSGSDTTVLRLEGSTTVAPLMEKYAEIYEGYTNVRIEITPNGSQNGVDAANSGIANIGLSSRNAGHASHAGLTEIRIGVDTVVLIVGSGAGVTALTKTQVIGIYNGTITNWNQVGGENRLIVPVDRYEGSGTRSYFEESFASDGTSTLNINRNHASPAGGTGAVIGFVSSNPGAIAYVSLGSLVTDAEKGMAVALDMTNAGTGTAFSPITQLDSYTLKRDLVLLVKGEPTGPVSVFISWILGTEGQKILEEAGYLPLAALS